MDYQKYDTPTQTRSWDTTERETYREFLTLETRAQRLAPTDEEMEAIHRTALVLTHGLERSVRPVRFLNRVYGTTGKETLSEPDSSRCTRGLKLAYAMYQEIKDHLEAGIHETETVPCPVCTEETTAYISQLPVYREGIMDFMGDNAVVAVDRECDCRYGIEDLAIIERASTATEHFVDERV